MLILPFMITQQGIMFSQFSKNWFARDEIIL